MPRAAALVLLMAFAFLSGCNREKKTDPSLGEWFKEKQANMTNTRGTIDMDTVEEKDGAVYYRTSDGKRWKQQYRKLGPGEFERVGDPEEVPPLPPEMTEA